MGDKNLSLQERKRQLLLFMLRNCRVTFIRMEDGSTMKRLTEPGFQKVLLRSDIMEVGKPVRARFLKGRKERYPGRAEISYLMDIVNLLVQDGTCRIKSFRKNSYGHEIEFTLSAEELRAILGVLGSADEATYADLLTDEYFNYYGYKHVINDPSIKELFPEHSRQYLEEVLENASEYSNPRSNWEISDKTYDEATSDALENAHRERLQRRRTQLEGGAGEAVIAAAQWAS